MDVFRIFRNGFGIFFLLVNFRPDCRILRFFVVFVSDHHISNYERGESGMIVRPFQLSDHEAIANLFRSVLPEPCCEETMKGLAKQLSLDPGLVLVAETGGTVSGVIIGTTDSKNCGYYYRIAVAAESRRRGIGKALVESLKQKFRNRKVGKIYVSLDEWNEPLLPFYQAAGYSADDFTRSFGYLRAGSKAN
jgi:ribosomal protein S18 acetylase RimI-like enzyme